MTERDKEILDCYSSHTVKYVAEKFSISQELVYKVLHANNISKHSRSESLRLHNIEKYGCETPPETAKQRVNQKRAQTKLDKYGDANYNNRTKFKDTSIRLHGGVGLASKEALAKSQQTCLENYGVSNPAQSHEVKEKTKQTLQSKYGVNSTFESEEIQKKIRQTCEDKYSVSSPGAIRSRVEAARLTALKNWSAENYCNREQARETMQKRYGVAIPLQSTAIREHASAVIQDKYGVPWNCMREEARLAGNNSFPNQEFASLLEKHNIPYQREFVIENYSYDFKVDNTLIEINPTATHNSTWTPFGNHEGVDKVYHQKKQQTAVNNGYRCLMIWDWDNKEKIIRSLIGKERVFARCCDIKSVSQSEAAEFINTYHFQNYAKDSIRIGLYYQNSLISIMTFDTPRYNKNYKYELIRYCSSKTVIGGAEKLFAYFVKEYLPESIISYCDDSKFSGTVYLKLGFAANKPPSPSKHWYNIKTRKHYTDNLVRQRGVDQLLGVSFGKGTNNEDLMRQHGFVEIYDCGQSVYSWQNN